VLDDYARLLEKAEVQRHLPPGEPLILKLNNRDSLLDEKDPDQAVTGSVKDALRLGCVGVGYTIYPGSAHRLEMYGTLRDIAAEPTLAEGDVTRKWTKGNFFIFFLPSYYIAVKGKIFSIRRVDYIGILEGDLVRISHYPHSLTVESLHLYDSALKKFVPAVGGEQV